MKIILKMKNRLIIFQNLKQIFIFKKRNIIILI